MSSRKNKNKNRQNKTPNINLFQKTNVPKLAEKNDELKIEEKPEIVLKSEECSTSKIVSDIGEVETPQPIIESKELETDAPKKPKRNRGKKKKQDEEDDVGVSKERLQVTESIIEDVKIDPEVENNKNEALEYKETVEAANIIPVARKKKNKNKKNTEMETEMVIKYDDTVVPETKHRKSVEKEVDMQLESKEIEKEPCDETKEETSLSKVVNTTEQESKSKKRNKKKHNRNDSEKSDKAEDVTSFVSEKLLDVQNKDVTNDVTMTKSENQERDNQSEVLNVEVIEVEIKTDIDLIPEMNTSELVVSSEQKISIEHDLKDESSKFKNKKEKKQYIKLDNRRDEREQGRKNDEKSNSPAAIGINLSVESALNSKHKDSLKAEVPIEHSSVVEIEKENPKFKDKIAKLVQKKSKDKLDEEAVFNLPENTTTESSTDIKLPLIEKDNDLIGTQEITEKSEDIMKSEEKQKEETIVNKETTVTLECGMRDKGELTPKLSIDFNLTTEVSDSIINTGSGFIQIDKTCEILLTEETDKKDTESSTQTIQSTEVSSAKTEDLEGLMFDTIPDFIEYPRSTSEQLDDNNNMVIQEITPMEDLKPDIPSEKSNTSNFQISSESPKNSAEIVSTDLKVLDMETKTSKTKEEKTDLKSKVMEVNQDMEELKLSIEKSLAELTVIENAEKEIEKQFEEKTQHKTQGITETEIKQNISDSAILPERKDHKGKGKSKKKGKQEAMHLSIVTESKDSKSKDSSQSIQKTEITEVKSDNSEDKSKKYSAHSVEEISETISSDTVTSVVADSKNTDSKDSTPTKEKSEQTEQRTEHSEEKSPKQSIETVEKLNYEKQEGDLVSTQIITESQNNTSKNSFQINKIRKNSEEKPTNIEDKCENQLTTCEDKLIDNVMSDEPWQSDFEPIENFEDALTSSVDDVNKTFEILASDANHVLESQSNIHINVIAPTDDTEKEDEKQKQEKENPVSQPKNLLGHINVPVPSNRTDYKKEKNKIPNNKQARVKIKDSVPIEDILKSEKQSKESQTENKRKSSDKIIKESISCVRNDNEEYIYKYSFRRVFLPSVCHVCKKDLNQQRVACNFCNLLFYCNQKHKDEDWSHHQALCFAVSTIIHLKNQKHIYSDAKNIAGQNYRLLRMQMIVSCEKVLKRKLVPWEQEALLYPRICADVSCREWRQGKLKDCESCGQISYCIEYPDHLPMSHQRWCKSYNLYQKLVCYQQTKGRLEPKLPTKVMVETYVIPEKINEVLASLYEEKIDMNDIQYAALTQLATAPLTTAFCYQLYKNRMNASYANGVQKNSSFTVHIVGADLQFEADALNKWEIFLFHLRPDLMDLRVVFIGNELNPSNLPLDLLGKIRLCQNCRENERRMLFSFQDKMSYHDYWASDEFVPPDIVCAFNASLQNLSSSLDNKDVWILSIDCILKLKIPFVLTSYTLSELRRNLAKINENSELKFNIISEPKFNSFASVRPDRNFISDDEMPLLFKNYCYAVVCGAF